MFAYLAVNLASLSFPLAFSFTRRFGFGEDAGRAWLAVSLSAVPLILWDHFFTAWGFWSFNPRFILGPRLLGLPMEEILFFFAIPFACLFIYNLLGKNPRLSVPRRAAAWAWALWALLLLAVALLNTGKAYTVAVFLLGAAAAGSQALFRPRHSGRLLAAVLAQYLPFAIVNGILTALPVFRYDESAILGVRLGSIPVEDAVYAMAMLVATVSIFESLRERKPGGTQA